jgi:integrase
MNENIKAKKRNNEKVYLTEANINKLKGLDKERKYFDTNRAGLFVKVSKQKLNESQEDISNKSWGYSYRPRGCKPTSIYLGSCKTISRAAAMNRLKQLESDIYNNKDPILEKERKKKEFTLQDLIKYWSDNKLNINNGYKPKTIESIKNTFKVWVLHQTVKPGFNSYFTYSIKDKKISSLNEDDIKIMYDAVRKKSGYVANRLISYLKIVFNYAIENNILKSTPIKIKKKSMFKELEANKILTEVERQNILNLTFVKDNRSDTINFSHYVKNNLDIVNCLAIAWVILTGRRARTEGYCITKEMINWEYKTIYFKGSKTGEKTYKIPEKAFDLLKTIVRSRNLTITYPGKKYKSKTTVDRIVPTPWAPIDQRADYFFPSKFFGKSSKTPHITEVKSTWKRVLQQCSIKYLPLKQARHTMATLVYKKSKNLKAVQELLGHSKITTSMRYTKALSDDVNAAINSVDVDNQTQQVEILEFKK